MTSLVVTIPSRNAFYTIYADGLHSRKSYDDSQKRAVIHYPPDAVVFLYYTYPTHREACVIRNTAAEAGVTLSGLSKKVTVIFSAQASGVDKLKRAAAFLNKNAGGAFVHDDGFYARLGFLLEQRGKLNYFALRNLVQSVSQQILLL